MIGAVLIAAPTAIVAATTAVRNGRTPLLLTDPPGSEHRLLCGYVHGKREVWRIFPVPVLLRTTGSVKCPSEINLTPGELRP